VNENYTEAILEAGIPSPMKNPGWMFVESMTHRGSYRHFSIFAIGETESGEDFLA
jgi:hypothetical protein